MKEVRVVIDRDEIEEILREHLEGMFPTLEIESILGLGYSDVTITLRKPGAPVEAARALDPGAGDPEMPEVPF